MMKELPGHLVEAESGFDHKAAIRREGQVEQGQKHEYGTRAEDFAPHAACHGARPAKHRINTAREGKSDQQESAEHRFDQAKPELGTCVVGGLVMRTQIDRRREIVRYRIAMRGHAACLAQGQPGLEHKHERERGDKQKTKEGGGHEPCRGW